MLGFCFKNQQRICPRCRCRKLWKLADGKRCCSRCRYSFHDLSGRWINACRLPLDDWLRVVKLFELELSTRKIAEQMNLAYNTAHKAVMTIRYAILAHADDAEDILLGGEVELDESYFGGKRKGKRGRGAAGKVPVFGVLERDGRVYVQVVPNVKATTLLGFTTKKVRRGSLVYTDKYKAYDTLMFCGYRHGETLDNASERERSIFSVRTAGCVDLPTSVAKSSCPCTHHTCSRPKQKIFNFSGSSYIR